MPKKMEFLICFLRRRVCSYLAYIFNPLIIGSINLLILEWKAKNFNSGLKKLVRLEEQIESQQWKYDSINLIYAKFIDIHVMVSWQDFTLIIIYMMNSPLIKPIYIIFHGTQGLKMAFTVELADTFSISPIVLVASTVHLISSQSSSYSTRSTQYLAAHAKHHNFVDELIHRHDNIIYEQE